MVQVCVFINKINVIKMINNIKQFSSLMEGMNSKAEIQ